jgi:hypothetical protein
MTPESRKYAVREAEQKRLLLDNRWLSACSKYNILFMN